MDKDNIIINQNKSYMIVKRVIDVLGSLVGMLLFPPISIIIIIIIKIEDGGPIIFKQQRVGKNNKLFYIYKFRSMNIHAEKQKHQIMQQNEMDGAMFKIQYDPRVTKFGKFLRKRSLDEVPQLFNVLMGDMSLVGPRPPIVEEFKQYTDYQKQRLLVLPGLTGLWQISGRNHLTFDEMINLDLKYIKNPSIVLDIKIMLVTIFEMINTKKNGAF